MNSNCQFPIPPSVVLTIAGSDSGAGAGIQADLKAIHAHGVYAATVVTAITAQNTQGVRSTFEIPPALVAAQLDAVLEDFPVAVVKTGMLSSAAIINVVVEKLRALGGVPLVVDPVMVSTSGSILMQRDAFGPLTQDLFPLATLITPNSYEAAHLTGREVRTLDDAREAARRLQALGPQAVLVKGGHLKEGKAVDVLFDGKAFFSYAADYIDTSHTHGTGCTYASAIAANLAKSYPLHAAVDRAKRYVTKAIRHGLSLGQGSGPTDPFYFLKDVALFPLEGDGVT